MRTKYYLYVLITALFITGCVSDDNITYFDKAPLMGMLYNQNNEPCDGVLVTVDPGEDDDPLKQNILSDINGRFAIPNLKRGIHTVLFQKEGYEDLLLEINFTTRTQILYSHLYSAEDLIARAQDEIEKRRYAAAEEYLIRAEKVALKQHELLFTRSILAYKREDYDSSLGYILPLRKDFPYNRSLLVFEADIRVKMDQLEHALSLYMEAQELKHTKDVENQIKMIFTQIDDKEI